MSGWWQFCWNERDVACVLAQKYVQGRCRTVGRFAEPGANLLERFYVKKKQ